MNTIPVGIIYEPDKEVTVDTVLRYGEVLTDDQINFSCNGIGTWVRIRTVKENGQLYYIRMVNGEVEEFKELI